MGRILKRSIPVLVLICLLMYGGQVQAQCSKGSCRVAAPAKAVRVVKRTTTKSVKKVRNVRSKKPVRRVAKKVFGRCK